MHLAGFQLGDVQQIVDMLQQGASVPRDDFEIVALAGIQMGGVQHFLGRAEYQGKRCAEFVADIREESSLHLAQFCRLLVESGQFLVGRFQPPVRFLYLPRAQIDLGFHLLGVCP